MLDQLADLSEILGEQSFRVGAYRRAAARIRDTASPVAVVRSSSVRVTPLWRDTYHTGKSSSSRISISRSYSGSTPGCHRFSLILAFF